ncbi:MAG: hypothetical protein H6773_03685 [Pseudomonadales bacterium]|nr:hypothetical protein [Pseudomonadales bacterium]
MPLLSFGSSNQAVSETQSPGLFVLGVWITNSVVKTLLLQLQEGRVTLVRESKAKSYKSVSEAVTVTDTLLQDLGTESENTNDVIFILDQGWVLHGDIALDKKPCIKSITDELDLSPIGFVESIEAISSFAIQNNPRFSGIFAAISSSAVTITVVDRAVVSGTEVVGRSDLVSKDIIEGLARFAQANDERATYLPPQIFLVSLEESEEDLQTIQQALLAENLTDSAKFLQAPMIVAMSEQEYVSQIVQAAGDAISDAKGLATAKNKARIPLKDQFSPVKDETANVQPVSAEELGFSEVTKKQAASMMHETAVDEMDTTEAPTSFGIPIANVAVPATVLNTSSSNPVLPKTEDDDDDKDEDIPQAKKANGSFFKKHHMNPKVFIGLGLGLGILVLALLAGAFVLFQTTAVVAITLDKRTVATEATIAVSADISETNVEDAILAAETITHEVSGENTILTTGVKIVGENAKGMIKLYNKTTADKDLAAGTVVKTGDREFTLDEDVTVPAATVIEKTSGEEKEYGTLETAVTATDIGAEGNISKDTELTVSSFADSSYEAVAKDDFSGGSSREVRVVSASDQAEAVKELQTELEVQALKELEDMMGAGEYVLPTLAITKKSVTFSSEIDDEVNEVTAYVTLTVEALKYSAESLQPLATELLKSEVPEGYFLSDQVPDIMSQPLKDDEATESATMILANITSKAIPELDIESLYPYILGKSSEDATKNLEDHQAIDTASITISPSLLSKVPADAQKVTITIVEE